MRLYFSLLCLALTMTLPVAAHDESTIGLYPTAQQFLDFYKNLEWDFMVELSNQASFKVFVRRCDEVELLERSRVKLLVNNFVGSQMRDGLNYFDITLIERKRGEAGARCARVAIVPTIMVLILTIEAVY